MEEDMVSYVQGTMRLNTVQYMSTNTKITMLLLHANNRNPPKKPRPEQSVKPTISEGKAYSISVKYFIQANDEDITEAIRPTTTRILVEHSACHIGLSFPQPSDARNHLSLSHAVLSLGRRKDKKRPQPAATKLRRTSLCYQSLNPVTEYRFSNSAFSKQSPLLIIAVSFLVKIENLLNYYRIDTCNNKHDGALQPRWAQRSGVCANKST